jgi:hypothetical protein
MVKVPIIYRGDDWEYVHTVSVSSGSITGARISMTWKYADGAASAADSAAAAKIATDTNAATVGKITILTGTTFRAEIPSVFTKTITPGQLVVDIQYELPSGKVKTEQNLDKNTRCDWDVTRDTA